MTCPHCDGRGFTIGFGCPGFRRMKLDCRSCSESGQVDQAFMDRHAAGETLREARLRKDLTLREAAKKYGVKASELSDAERGRIDPAPLLAKMETP